VCASITRLPFYIISNLLKLCIWNSITASYWGKAHHCSPPPHMDGMSDLWFHTTRRYGLLCLSVFFRYLFLFRGLKEGIWMSEGLVLLLKKIKAYGSY
jgi:hypothetical protein